jgi:hypothetical protein
MKIALRTDNLLIGKWIDIVPTQDSVQYRMGSDVVGTSSKEWRIRVGDLVSECVSTGGKPSGTLLWRVFVDGGGKEKAVELLSEGSIPFRRLVHPHSAPGVTGPAIHCVEHHENAVECAGEVVTVPCATGWEVQKPGLDFIGYPIHVDRWVGDIPILPICCFFLWANFVLLVHTGIGVPRL